MTEPTTNNARRTTAFDTPSGRITVSHDPLGVAVGDGAATPLVVRPVPGPRGALAVDVGGRRVLIWSAVTTQGTQATRHVATLGRCTHFMEVRNARRGGGAEPSDLGSPMPGTVLDVRVAAGDVVAKGAVLVVIEAMKMEHSVVAPSAARVRAVFVQRGDRTTPGQPLVDLEPVA